MFGPSSALKSSKSHCYSGITGALTVPFNPTTSKYTISYDGKSIETTVTDKATIVDQWVQGINLQYPPNSSVIVGLGIEESPTKSKSATLHLCIDDKCLILQLFHIVDFPLFLKNFLMNPNLYFVGVGVAHKIYNLKYEYDIHCGGVHADIKKLAMEKWPGRFNKPGLKDLAKELLGLSMKKPKLVSMSNWENRVLSIAQVEYGCIHAYVSSKIGSMLLKDG
ncbi:hypothetical protein PIB30_058739 [Stylosanthes scabra]|uniref:3'-5' exonuclease domain-containing protein n=1 Tax=Stylosanthes scabra TaxID=79078 RepID=A0ABU6WJN6_9FABA|nr:hypothetical protein [Stylosanthes scabra]